MPINPQKFMYAPSYVCGDRQEMLLSTKANITQFREGTRTVIQGTVRVGENLFLMQTVTQGSAGRPQNSCMEFAQLDFSGTTAFSAGSYLHSRPSVLEV